MIQGFYWMFKNTNDAYKTIEECNPSRKCYVLVVSDDMISDLISNKNLQVVIISGRKRNISTVYIS